MATVTIYPQGGGYTGWVLTEQRVRVCITGLQPTPAGAQAEAERYLADPANRRRFNVVWAGQYSLPLEEGR